MLLALHMDTLQVWYSRGFPVVVEDAVLSDHCPVMFDVMGMKLLAVCHGRVIKSTTAAAFNPVQQHIASWTPLQP